MITEVGADLFTIDAPAYAHGVNCRGVMGAGIARAFRARYPEMYNAYRRCCLSGQLQPGKVFTWGGPPVVYNLATQQSTGPCASLDALDKALQAMKVSMWADGIERVAMPRVCCGIGGLSWRDVRRVLERHQSIDIIVATLPEKT